MLKITDLKKFTPFQWLWAFIVVVVLAIFLAGFLKMIFLPVVIGLVVWQILVFILGKEH